MTGPRRPYLGAGIGLRRPHLAELLTENGPSELVLELIPAHVFADPGPVEGLAGRHPIVLHDVDASLATAGDDARRDAHLERVRELARRVGALAYTEHLAMSRSPAGLDLGHLAPIPRTHAQLRLLVERVTRLGDRLELPVGLELPVTALELPGAELDEGAFVARLCRQSGCELHLDLENLRVDAHNGIPAIPEPKCASEDARRWSDQLAAAGVGPGPIRERLAWRLSQLPLEHLGSIHLAGGRVDGEGMAIDSHDRPVPPITWALLRALRASGLASPRTIVVEHDRDLPPLASLCAQAARADEIWRDRAC